MSSRPHWPGKWITQAMIMWEGLTERSGDVRGGSAESRQEVPELHHPPPLQLLRLGTPLWSNHPPHMSLANRSSRILEARLRSTVPITNPTNTHPPHKRVLAHLDGSSRDVALVCEGQDVRLEVPEAERLALAMGGQQRQQPRARLSHARLPLPLQRQHLQHALDPQALDRRADGACPTTRAISTTSGLDKQE
jgi:hypothetical protein